MIGKPYRLGARGPQEFDCVGATLEMCRRLGLPMNDPWLQVRERWERGERDVHKLFAFPDGWCRVTSPRVQVGDVVIYKVNHLGAVGHVGIVSAPGLVLTASSAANVYAHSYVANLDHVEQVWRFSA